MRTQRMDKTKTGEAQEAVLSWLPFEIGWDGDTRETVLFDADLCLLAQTVFEESA